MYYRCGLVQVSAGVWWDPIDQNQRVLSYVAVTPIY